MGALMGSLNKTNSALNDVTPEMIAKIIACANGMIRAHWVWTPQETADLELCRDRGDPDERERSFDSLWRKFYASGAKAKTLPSKPNTKADVARIDVLAMFRCVDEMLAFRSLRTRSGGVTLEEVRVHVRRETRRELSSQLLGHILALSGGMVDAQWFF